MKVFVLIASLLIIGLECQAAAPRVPQRFVISDPSAFNTETGQLRTLPSSQDELVRDAFHITDVRFDPYTSNTIVLTGVRSDFLQKDLTIRFTMYDSARIFKDILVNSQRPLLIIKKGIDRRLFYSITRASDIYVWNEQNSSMMQIGEIVGPLRSYDEQPAWSRLLIDWFGKELLNVVRFEAPAEEFDGLREI